MGKLARPRVHARHGVSAVGKTTYKGGSPNKFHIPQSHGYSKPVSGPSAAFPGNMNGTAFGGNDGGL